MGLLIDILISIFLGLGVVIALLYLIAIGKMLFEDWRDGDE